MLHCVGVVVEPDTVEVVGPAFVEELPVVVEFSDGDTVSDTVEVVGPAVVGELPVVVEFSDGDTVTDTVEVVGLTVVDELPVVVDGPNVVELFKQLQPSGSFTIKKWYTRVNARYFF